MEAVIRAAAIYAALLVVFKIAGRRTLAEITNFDLVLLLIISEATQQALLGEDFSVANGIIVIFSLVGIDIGLSLFKGRFPKLSRIVDGMAMIVVEDGKLLHERVRRARLSESDILAAARCTQGLERVEQIKFAVLEKNGKISIIPKE